MQIARVIQIAERTEGDSIVASLCQPSTHAFRDPLKTLSNSRLTTKGKRIPLNRLSTRDYISLDMEFLYSISIYLFQY